MLLLIFATGFTEVSCSSGCQPQILFKKMLCLLGMTQVASTWICSLASANLSQFLTGKKTNNRIDPETCRPEWYRNNSNKNAVRQHYITPES